MFKSNIESFYRREDNTRIYQGDIFKDIRFIAGDPAKESEKDIISLSYAVVLSQDCDLQEDFNSRAKEENQDKFLLSLLICPAFMIEDFAKGKHLGEWEMQTFNSDLVKRICKNDSYKRYHFLEGESELSIPKIVIDFKHFFTLPRDFLYEQREDKYVASLNELFRENLSQRFSNYLSRIGLPEL